MKTWIVSAALAAALMGACNRGPSGLPADNRRMFGIIRDDCGPTDGPQTLIVLTDSQTTCASWPQDTVKTYYQVRIDGVRRAHFPLGESHRLRGEVRTISKGVFDPTADSITVDLTDTTGETVKGDFQFDSGPFPAGGFELKKCPVEFLCG